MGLNTQEEDQKGTSVEQRDQEGSEGSNAPSRPERQDTGRPSTMDTAPPHIVTEMQMMKESMDFMMNAFRGRVSSDLDDLVHRIDSPFTAPVTSFPLPLKFRMPKFSIWLVQEGPQNLPMDGSEHPIDGFVPKMVQIDNPIIGFIEEDAKCLHHPQTMRLWLAYGWGTTTPTKSLWIIGALLTSFTTQHSNR